MDFVTIISNVGFPIAACVAMACYVKEQMKAHAKEMTAITTALENNTEAIKQLSDRIERRE